MGCTPAARSADPGRRGNRDRRRRVCRPAGRPPDRGTEALGARSRSSSRRGGRRGGCPRGSRLRGGEHDLRDDHVVRRALRELTRPGGFQHPEPPLVGQVRGADAGRRRLGADTRRGEEHDRRQRRTEERRRAAQEACADGRPLLLVTRLPPCSSSHDAGPAQSSAATRLLIPRSAHDEPGSGRSQGHSGTRSSPSLFGDGGRYPLRWARCR